jgi:ABC-2 type transport system ATP-binding protein
MYIWQYIKEMNRQKNVTVVLTTHYMDEADFLCNRVAIIDNGKIVALDSPKDLERHDWSRHHNFEAPIDSETFLGSLQAFDWTKSTHRSNGAIELMVPCESKIPEIIINASRNNVAIRSVGLHEPNLEDVFLKFTGKKIREAESATKEG